MHLFSGRDGVFSCQTDTGYIPIRHELQKSDVKAHFNGRKTIGIYQLKENNSIKFAAFDVDIHNLHPEIFKLLGRLKYRTSFGQNALQHSLEVAYVMNTLASELGLNPKIAKRAGLLHDLGKAVDQQQEGTHAALGGELAKRYGEKEIVINAIEAHHEEKEITSIYTVLAIVADAISASRPGARKETLQNYAKRLKDLEDIANSFSEVEKSFAIQAGREVRIIVSPEKADDDKCLVLSRDIKNKIEEEMDYPGQIKVTVIRETRAVDFAK